MLMSVKTGLGGSASFLSLFLFLLFLTRKGFNQSKSLHLSVIAFDQISYSQLFFYLFTFFIVCISFLVMFLMWRQKTNLHTKVISSQAQCLLSVKLIHITV